MGQPAIITGGAGGIGLEIATALAGEGYTVVLVDVNTEQVRAATDTLVERGFEAIPADVDINDFERLETLVDEVTSTIGCPSVLVNCAAISRRKDLLSLSVDDWSSVLSTNLTSTFVLSRLVVRKMAEAGSGGSIVNVGSISAVTGDPFGGAYPVSKAALIALTMQMATEWGQYGVRCNIVAPGFVRTPLSEISYQDADLRGRREDAVPLHRIGVPADVAGVVSFLVSEQATYLTGTHIPVDGGLCQNLFPSVAVPRSRQ